MVADKQAANAVYVAASGGGVWHSTDGGVHWDPVWPADNVQTMGSLAEASDGTLWAGTGEANPPGGGLTYFGDGIYKSTDGGAHWTNMGLRDSAAIGRIAIDPSNPDIVFAAASGHVARSVPERGLYRTGDGGKTWQRVIAPANATTGAIDVAIDPSNHNRVFAAMWDHIRNNGARVYGGIGSGLFRSDDGGQTWTRLQNIVDPLPDYDRPTDGGGAGTGTLTSGSATITNIATTSGAFQVGHHIVGTSIPASTFITAVDTAGRTLTISKAATANAATRALTDFRPPTGLTADPSLGRIGVDGRLRPVPGAQFNRIYVVTGSPYGPDKGFYWSDDGGDSFHVGAQAYQASSGYQWWFGRLWVDPEDALHIFNADVQLRTSTNGGTSWTSISQPHSDQHGMDWDMSTYDNDPTTPMRVWLGNDGGAYRSDNSGRPNSWIQPGIPAPTGTGTVPHQPWNQSYHLDVSRTDSQRLVTGLQDNGSQRTWTATAPSPTDPELKNWNSHGGATATGTLIDPVDQTYYYECFQPSPPSMSCTGHHDTATATQTIRLDNTNTGQNPPGTWPANQRWTTDTPIAIDPNNDAVIYLAGTVIGRSLNRGVNFTVISPNDPNSLPGPVPPDENDLGPFYANEYATISAIAPAKAATTVPYAQTIYVGHGHRARVEDDRRGRELDAPPGPAGALGERARGRSGRREPRLRGVLRLPRGRRGGQRVRDARRRRDVDEHLPEPAQRAGGDDHLRRRARRAVRGHRRRRLRPQGQRLLLVQDQRRAAERAGAGRQALRRRQVRVRGHVRPVRVEAPAVHGRDRRRRRRARASRRRWR